MPSAEFRGFIGKFSQSFVLRVAWLGITYVNLTLFAFILSDENYGILVFYLSLITFMVQVYLLGARNTLIRYVSQYEQQEKAGLIRPVISFFQKVTIVFSVTVSAVIVGFGYYFEGYQYSLLAICLMIVTVLVQMDILSAVARAFGSIFWALAPKDILWRGLLIPCAFLAVFLAETDKQVFVILALSLGTSFGVFGALFLKVKKMNAGLQAGEDIQGHNKEWVSVATPIWISTVAQVSFRSVDVLILGLLIAKSEVGWYFFAARAASLVSFVLTTANIINGPRMSRLFHTDKMKELQKYLAQNAVLISGVSFLVFLGMVAMGKPMLGFVGPGFATMYPELLVLSLGHLINSFTGSAGVLMNMTGHQKKAAEITITTAIAATAMMAISSYYYGTMGAAVSVALGLSVANIRNYLYIKRKMRLETSVLQFLGRKARLQDTGDT